MRFFLFLYLFISFFSLQFFIPNNKAVAGILKGGYNKKFKPIGSNPVLYIHKPITTSIIGKSGRKKKKLEWNNPILVKPSPKLPSHVSKSKVSSISELICKGKIKSNCSWNTPTKLPNESSWETQLYEPKPSWKTKLYDPKSLYFN